MRSTIVPFPTVALAISAGLCIALTSPAFAEPPSNTPDQQNPNRPADPVRTDVPVDRTTEPVQPAVKQRAVMLVPADWVHGRDVYGLDDKKIGDVKDVLIGSDTGFAEYLIISRGGLLGMGATNVAVPVMAFDWNEGKKTLTLPVTKDELKNAPEMKGDDWKYLTEDARRDALRTHYHVDASRRRWPDMHRIPSNDKDVLKDWSLVRFSDIKGQKLMSDQAVELGTVKDIVFDLPSGRQAFLVISHGGTAGVGAKRVAVPWDYIAVNNEGKLYAMKLDPETIKAAPVFDKDDWSELRRPGYGRSIYQYYKKDPAWLDSASSPIGAADRNRDFDELYLKGSPIEVGGTIVRIEDMKPMHAMAEHRAIIVRNEKGDETTVCLAPAATLKDRGILLRTGDRVVINGRMIDNNGRKMVVARQYIPASGGPITLYVEPAGTR